MEDFAAHVEDRPVVWRTASGVDGLVLGHRTARDRFLRPDGTVLLALSAPRRRSWAGVRLTADEPVAAQETPEGWAFAGPAEVDLLEVPPDVDLDDRATTLTVLGAFTELGGANTLGRFLVGGQVLDPTDFDGARCPSEQTALGIYRVARLRRGAFWDGVADLVAGWAADRVGAKRLVHDLLGEGETHTRFVADAVLLLSAHGDEHGVRRALGHLDALAVGHGALRWWRHDSLEDGSDLVLNTHLLALVARRAAGIDDSDGVGALHDALAARPPRLRAGAHAADLLLGDAASGLVDAHRHTWAGRQAHAAEVRAARERGRHPHLVLPGGRTARDVRPAPAPAYHTVNTADLASYAMVTGDPQVRRAALAAARYARASGHWRALRRTRAPITLLVPAVLWRLDDRRAADRWAARLRADGWAPALGWPGLIDRPWPRLPAGAL